MSDEEKWPDRTPAERRLLEEMVDQNGKEFVKENADRIVNQAHAWGYISWYKEGSPGPPDSPIPSDYYLLRWEGPHQGYPQETKATSSEEAAEDLLDGIEASAPYPPDESWGLPPDRSQDILLVLDTVGNRHVVRPRAAPIYVPEQIIRDSFDDEEVEHFELIWDHLEETGNPPPEGPETRPTGSRSTEGPPGGPGTGQAPPPTDDREPNETTASPEAPDMTNPRPTTTTTQTGATTEATSEDPLEPTVDDPGDDGPTRYYLLMWNAPDDEPVPTTTADRAPEAAWELAPRDLKTAAPHPPGERWLPNPDPTPDLRLVLDIEDHRYVLDEATWPESTMRTHGALRARYNEQEVQEFQEHWEDLAETWRKLASDDHPGEYEGPTTKRDDSEEIKEEQRSSGWIHPDYAHHLFLDQNLERLGYERVDGEWYAVVKPADTPEDGEAWRVGGFGEE